MPHFDPAQLQDVLSNIATRILTAYRWSKFKSELEFYSQLPLFIWREAPAPQSVKSDYEPISTKNISTVPKTCGLLAAPKSATPTAQFFDDFIAVYGASGQRGKAIGCHGCQ